MNALCDSFGQTVRHLREVQCWSQEMLAEKAALNRSYVGEIERGKAVASLITIEKFANAFCLKGSDLLARSEQKRDAKLVRGINLASIAC